MIKHKCNLSCPVCDQEFKIVVSFDSVQSGVGSHSVCPKCTSFLVFGSDQQLRLMIEEEVAELPDALRIFMQRFREEFS